MLKHIEFFGIPGVGKTTAYQQCLKILKRRRKNACSLNEAAYQALGSCTQTEHLRFLPRLLPYSIGQRLLARIPKTTDDILYTTFQRFLAQHPRLADIVQHYQLLSSQDAHDLGLLAFWWFVELFAKYQLICEGVSRETWMLLDEGFCQRVVSIFAYLPSHKYPDISDNLKTYIANIPLPDSVFFLTASPEIVKARMDARGYPMRMRSMPPDERLAILERAASLLVMVQELLQQRQVTLFYIDNNGSEAYFTQQIEQALKHILS